MEKTIRLFATILNEMVFDPEKKQGDILSHFSNCKSCIHQFWKVEVAAYVSMLRGLVNEKAS